MNQCKERVEVYSRVVGFFRPVQDWNKGKKEEFGDRKEYEITDKTRFLFTHTQKELEALLYD